MIPSKLSNVKWFNLFFFVASPIGAIVGTTWLLKNGGPHWATWILALLMWFSSGLTVTAGYHRLFSHRSYQANGFIRFLYILFGSAALEGSARWWCLGHRYHHRYVDTQDDPYGINKGFWYAHIGWLLTKDHDRMVGYGQIKDLEKDPLIRIQDRYYVFFMVIMGFLFPIGIASLWGDPWGGFFVAGLGRIVLNHHLTFCINSVCHTIGKQTYSDKHSAKDSWIAAVLTYGEGYHNFHHEFQSDYRNGIKGYQWDPTKWLIRTLNWMGMTRNLHIVSRERILRAKLQMDQKRFAASAHVAIERTEEFLASAREQLQKTHDRFLALRREYQRVRAEKIDFMAECAEKLKSDLREAQKEFKKAMTAWRLLMKAPSLITN
ncbi:MAG: fatty acid desaturase [Deltaproteobacteria bacterium]|nr:fatty acid desaturase [Deltaproteobacteria bacterium]